jgi:AcrR family transcriptional regulator
MSRERSILEAATRLFAERSYDGVGIDAIAKESGIVGSGIYRHFASKEEILVGIFDRLIDELLVQMGTALPDPEAEMDRLIEMHVRFVLANPDLTSIWQREQGILTDSSRRSFHRRQHIYVDRWIETLHALFPGQPRPQIAATGRAVHCLISSDLTRPRTTPPPHGLADLLSTMARAACHALGAARPLTDAG